MKAKLLVERRGHVTVRPRLFARRFASGERRPTRPRASHHLTIQSPPLTAHWPGFSSKYPPFRRFPHPPPNPPTPGPAHQRPVRPASSFSFCSAQFLILFLFLSSLSLFSLSLCSSLSLVFSSSFSPLLVSFRPSSRPLPLLSLFLLPLSPLSSPLLSFSLLFSTPFPFLNSPLPLFLLSLPRSPARLPLINSFYIIQQLSTLDNVAARTPSPPSPSSSSPSPVTSSPSLFSLSFLSSSPTSLPSFHPPLPLPPPLFSSSLPPSSFLTLASFLLPSSSSSSPLLPLLLPLPPLFRSSSPPFPLLSFPSSPPLPSVPLSRSLILSFPLGSSSLLSLSSPSFSSSPSSSSSPPHPHPPALSPVSSSSLLSSSPPLPSLLCLPLPFLLPLPLPPLLLPLLRSPSSHRPRSPLPPLSLFALSPPLPPPLPLPLPASCSSLPSSSSSRLPFLLLVCLPAPPRLPLPPLITSVSAPSLSSSSSRASLCRSGFALSSPLRFWVFVSGSGVLFSSSSGSPVVLLVLPSVFPLLYLFLLPSPFLSLFPLSSLSLFLCALYWLFSVCLYVSPFRPASCSSPPSLIAAWPCCPLCAVPFRAREAYLLRPAFVVVSLCVCLPSPLASLLLHPRWLRGRSPSSPLSALDSSSLFLLPSSPPFPLLHSPLSSSLPLFLPPASSLPPSPLLASSLLSSVRLCRCVPSSGSFSPLPLSLPQAFVPLRFWPLFLLLSLPLPLAACVPSPFFLLLSGLPPLSSSFVPLPLLLWWASSSSSSRSSLGPSSRCPPLGSSSLPLPRPLPLPLSSIGPSSSPRFAVVSVPPRVPSSFLSSVPLLAAVSPSSAPLSPSFLYPFWGPLVRGQLALSPRSFPSSARPLSSSLTCRPVGGRPCLVLGWSALPSLLSRSSGGVRSVLLASRVASVRSSSVWGVGWWVWWGGVVGGWGVVSLQCVPASSLGAHTLFPPACLLRRVPCLFSLLFFRSACICFWLGCLVGLGVSPLVRGGAVPPRRLGDPLLSRLVAAVAGSRSLFACRGSPVLRSRVRSLPASSFPPRVSLVWCFGCSCCGRLTSSLLVVSASFLLFAVSPSRSRSFPRSSLCPLGPRLLLR
ncbi:hypothetical protein C7M84_019200 [Penaeus vannamei]|uniref:Uncharacterized protein n=1 Tax=Penaeus vannamei TaxID=6689 RepID=A0A423SFJ0_PENVA|nr:hypothetical protein C7M84_019200 [Penaeus vannamei]